MNHEFEPGSFNPATFNPHDPAFIKNPNPFYTWFRHHAPISWVGSVYNSYWIFRWQDVHSVLTGTDLWLKNNPVPTGSPPPGFRVLGNMPEGIFTLDNPRHDIVRRDLEPLFSKAIEGIQPVTAEKAAPLLRQIAERGRFELIQEFALPLPSQALCHVLGVPEQDWPLIMQWVLAILLADDPTRGPAVLGAGGTSSMALRSYYQALLHKGPVQPVTGQMVAEMRNIVECSPAQISTDEVIANAVTMSIAGYYSTTFLIGTGVLNLLQNPGAMTALRESVKSGEAGLLQSAVAEMLRYDGPVQLIDRYAGEDTQIAGQALPKGTKVTVVTGSANFDEDVFSNAQMFDIERDNSKMLSFGDGIHRCLGEPLADQVAPVAFRSLLTELPEFALGGQAQWQTDPYLRAVSNLPLTFS